MSTTKRSSRSRERLLLILAVLWAFGVVVFEAGSMTNSGIAIGNPVFDAVMSIAMMLAFLFFPALLAAAATFAGPTWWGMIIGMLGLIAGGIGVYYVITVPDGILTPLLIPIGLGVLLGASTMTIARRRDLSRSPATRSN